MIKKYNYTLILRKLWWKFNQHKIKILLTSVYVFWCWPLLLLLTALENEEFDLESVWFGGVLVMLMVPCQLIWVEFLLNTMGLL